MRHEIRPSSDELQARAPHALRSLGVTVPRSSCSAPSPFPANTHDPGKVSVVLPIRPLRMHHGRREPTSARPDWLEECSDSGIRWDSPLSPRSSSSRHPPLPLTSSQYRYRIGHFDNLRGTWKSRAYWEYTKSSDLGNPITGIRSGNVCQAGGLGGSGRKSGASSEKTRNPTVTGNEG